MKKKDCETSFSTLQTDKTLSVANFLPVSDEQINWGLYLTGAGHEKIYPGRTFRNDDRPELYRLEIGSGRILPEFAFLYMRSGSCVYESEYADRIQVSEGDYFAFFPGVWHRLIPGPDGLATLWITCNGAFLQDYMAKKLISPTQPVTKKDCIPASKGDNPDFVSPAEQLRKLIMTVLDNPLINKPQYSSLLFSYLTDVYFTRETAKNEESAGDLGADVSPNPEKAPEIVRSACREIWNWGHREIDINQLASKLNVSRRALERYFSKYQGRTIRDEVHQCRLYRAIHLLEQTNIEIKQIAFMAGFPSYNHMNRVFRRYLGCTAQDYR